MADRVKDLCTQITQNRNSQSLTPATHGIQLAQRVAEPEERLTIVVSKLYTSSQSQSYAIDVILRAYNFSR